MKPKEQPNARITPARGLVGLATLAGLLLAGVVGLKAIGIIEFGSPSQGAAIRVSRDAVQQRLTSPGSGKFKKSRIAARTEDDTFHVVYVEVDSQNGLGAALRTFALILTMDEGADGTSAIGVRQVESSPQAHHVQAIIDEGVSGNRTWVVEEWVTGSEYKTRPNAVAANSTANVEPRSVATVPEDARASTPATPAVPVTAKPYTSASPRYERLTDSVLVADFQVADGESAQNAAPRLIELGKDLCLVPRATVAKVRVTSPGGAQDGQLDLPLTSFLDFHSSDSTDQMMARAMWSQNAVLLLRNAGLQ